MFIQQDLSSEDSTVLPFPLKTSPCFLLSLDAFEIGNIFTGSGRVIWGQKFCNSLCRRRRAKGKAKKKNIAGNQCFFPEGFYSREIRRTYAGGVIRTFQTSKQILCYKVMDLSSRSVLCPRWKSQSVVIMLSSSSSQLVHNAAAHITLFLHPPPF